MKETIKLDGYVAISLEDYEEYQALKKPKIDYDRLKTGSVVRLKYTGSHCNGIDKFDLDRPVTILLYNFDGFFSDYRLRCITNTKYTTFIQENNLCHFTGKGRGYITEVISY
jgi:hypothetical protein